jgi:dienelactone hydrolase
MLSAALWLLSLGFVGTDDISFREGIAISGVVRSGRSPVFEDAVLASLIANGWKAPTLGEKIGTRTWDPVQAGQDGSFSGQAFQGGYAYFEVERPQEEVRILESSGWGMVYVDGEPRAGDPYGFGYVKLPVKLKRGKTGFLFSSGRGRPRARLAPPPSPAFFNLDDPTFPDLLAGQAGTHWGGVTVVNASEDWLRGARLRAKLDGGQQAEVPVPPIPPLTFRKVPFQIEAPAVGQPGEASLILTLVGERLLDLKRTSLRVRGSKQTRKVTFFSAIDGSVQYYAVNPAQGAGEGKALVLTLHGASVEAIGQADAYAGKEWCHIVAPTNRRPYGFDWEETGRLDALEVLSHAMATLKTDPAQTHLTGHSMGGHGAWTVGLHYPDHWAAVAPCAGWISFFTYGGGGRRAESTAQAEVLQRAASLSDTLLLLSNALHFPVYIHHGERDDTVPVEQAREMKKRLLEAGHSAVQSHEEPGAGHWFGGSVDWPGIFDLFKSSRLKSSAEKDEVHFATVNLAASSRAWWVQVLQQEKALAPTRVRFRRAGTRLIGTTENAAAIRFESEAFAKGANPRVIEIDGQSLSIPNVVDPPTPVILKKARGAWVATAGRLEGEKRPEQMGPFKEAFKNRFRYVYGTSGRPVETLANLTKARFDAEVFGYRGNGSVQILSDEEFLRELEAEKGRVYIRKPDVPNVVVVGNRDTNSAWARLLGGSPIEVRRGEVRVGGRAFRGGDLACLFVRPREGDDKALVGVLASTGPAGHRVLERIPYFVSGSHLSDWSVFDAKMLSNGMQGVRAAGNFRNDWGISASDSALE